MILLAAPTCSGLAERHHHQMHSWWLALLAIVIYLFCLG